MKLFSITLSLIAFSSMAISQNFDIYVSDAGNFNNPPWQILKYDQNGENGSVFIKENIAWPQDILFMENEQTVMITNLNSGKITRYNSESGVYIDDFTSGIGGPTRMKIGTDGLLYVLQWTGNGKVKRYQLDGTFVDDFTSAGVVSSIGLDWDQAGNLYVSSYNGKFIQRFDSEGKDLGKFISTNLLGPTNIWFTGNGDLIVIDYNAGNVKRFDSDGNFIEIMITGIPNGEGVDFLPNGQMLIGSGGNSSVGLYEEDGTLVKKIIPTGAAGLKTPNGVRLRMKNPSSTSDKILDIEFTTPTFGSSFTFNRKVLNSDIVSFEIFDSSGQVVHNIDHQEQAHWKASLFPNGVYFVTGKLSNGKAVRQKIIVKN